MDKTDQNKFNWVVATDAVAVHAFLLDSDKRNATLTSPAPYRKMETTIYHIKKQRVHVLLHETELVGMFTLNMDTPKQYQESIYPKAIKPAYLSRLAVNEEWSKKDPLIGLQCVRKAISLAELATCDYIRSEINPEITGVKTMLELLGFEQKGKKIPIDGKSPVAYMQKCFD